MSASEAASGVTVAVLNYNGRALLPVVLSSLAQQTVSGFHVRVLDNASTDDSVAFVAESFPGVEVLASAENVGVSANMARAVETTETEYLALLNNDLELDPRWLEEMLAELERHPRAAAADGKMLRYHEREVLDGAGDIVRRDGYPLRRGQGERDRGQYDSAQEVFSASGGAALYRREAFARVGSFDADLGAYYEDVDWGFRARLLGMPTRYVPGAVSYHMGSATLGGEPNRYAWQIVRNQVLVTVKNFPLALLARNLPRIAFFQAKWLVFDALHGRGRAHLRGLLAAAAAMPATLRKRRRIQRGRTVPLDALQRAFS